MWKYPCPSCAKAWVCSYRCDSICPCCYSPLSPVPAEEEETVQRSEWMDLQRVAWDHREALCQIPLKPLTKEHLDSLLAPVKVQGELDTETGRYRLRTLELPDGSKLHLGVSEGYPCIYNHEVPR